MSLIKRPEARTSPATEGVTKTATTKSNPFGASTDTGNAKSPSTFGLWNTVTGGIKKVGNVQSDFLRGQVKGVGKTLAGAAELGSGLLEGAYDATIGKATGTKALKGSEKAKEIGESDLLTPQNTAQKVGLGVEQVGEFLIPGGAASKVGKITEAANTATKVAKSVGRAALEGVEQGSRAAIQEGEINKNVGMAALLGSATEIVAKPVASISDRIGNAIFSLAVPSSPLQRAKDARKMMDVGKTISETGVSFNRNSLIQKVGENAQKFGKNLEAVIDKATKDKPYATYSIDELAKQVDESLSSQAVAKKMQISPVDVGSARKAIQERLDQYKEMYAGKELDLNDVQKLKQDLGSGLEALYKKALDAPVRAKALADIKLQSQLRQIIKDQIPEADKINKKLAPLLEARGRLENKGDYSGYLTDVISGTMAAGSAGDILSDPVGYMKRFATGVIAKRLGTSTASYTLAGTIAKDVAKVAKAPQFLQIIRRVLELSSQDQGDTENVDGNQSQ